MSQSALLRRLLRYVKPYSLLLAMALVFALLQVAMTLSAPVIIGQAVDAISFHRSRETEVLPRRCELVELENDVLPLPVGTHIPSVGLAAPYHRVNNAVRIHCFCLFVSAVATSHD